MKQKDSKKNLKDEDNIFFISDDKPLVAKIEVSNDLDVDVITTVNFNSDKSALIHIVGMTNLICVAPDMDNGVEANCKLAIQESCDSRAPNLYNKNMDDPWLSGINYFVTDPKTTETASAFRIDYGLGSSRTHGSAMVITIGAFSYCGILDHFPDSFKTLTANIDKYPEYSGSKDLNSSGTISLTYGIDGTFTYSFDLEDLEPNCEGCGIHVHAGISCRTHDLVKGHFWTRNIVRDLWTKAGGAVYATDARGYANGNFMNYNGFDIFSNMNHAVVVHAQDGARLGCGELKLDF